MRTHWSGCGEEGEKEKPHPNCKCYIEEVKDDDRGEGREKEEEGGTESWRKTGAGEMSEQSAVLPYTENGEYSGSAALTED
mgnify:CR=1 FL=1